MSEPEEDESEEDLLTPYLWLLLPAGVLFIFFSLVCRMPDAAALAATIVGSLAVAAVFSFLKRRDDASKLPSPNRATSAKMLALCRRLSEALLGQSPASTSGSHPDRPVLEPTDTGALLTSAQHGHFIQVHAGRDPLYGEEIRVAIGRDSGHFWSYSLHGRTDITRAVLSTEPVLVGDRAFDRRVKVQGPLPHSLALLTSEVRKAVLDGASEFWAAIELSTSPALVRLSSRTWLEERTSNLPSVAAIRSAISAYADVLQRLSLAPDELVARLGSNAADDPCAGTRLANLEVLIREHAKRESTRSLCVSALADPDPGVRLAAAVFVGGEQGFAALSGVVQSEKAPDDVRQRATHQVVKLYPAERSWPLLEKAAASAGFRFRRYIYQTAAESGNPEIVTQLCDFARRSPPDDCESIVRMLWHNESPCVEATLIALLARPELPVARAAIETLGMVGTVLAIAPLAELVSHTDLGEAAKEALRQVRNRTQAGDVGRVSLAAPDAQAGAISVARDGGDLELAPDGKASE